MGQIAYRANLSSSTFPMTIADGGRTVIIPGPDQNFDRRVDPTGEQKDAGIPQALYMENVIPTTNGYQSVGYIKSISGIAAAGAYLLGVFEVFSSTANVVHKNFIFQSDTGNLTCGQLGLDAVTYSGTAVATGDILSSAAVGTTAYIFAEGSDQLYTVSGSTGALLLTNITATVTPLNFFNTAGIKEIISFANYLIAIDFQGRTYWSSLTTSTDFVASLVSGAGSIVPNDLIGRVSGVEVSSAGFYIYTDQSGVFCQYTGNARYPFKFTPIKNFGGSPYVFPLRNKLSAGSVNVQGSVVVDRFRAVKSVERDMAEHLDPAISDFLSNGSTQALLDYATNVLTEQLASTVYPLVHIWKERYIVISINDSVASLTSQYTHAIVVDAATRRVGKFKVRHKFVISSDLYGLGFVESDAKVLRYLMLDIYNQKIPFTPNTLETSQAALLLGKFQYVRSRMMQMEKIEIEGPQNTAIVSSPNFSLALIPSQDGRNFDAPIPLSPASLSGGLVVYHCHHTARNHSILLKGAFSVNTLQLRFVPGGER